MRSLCCWRTLTPIAIGLCLMLAGSALAGDSLDDVKARQQVDAQRIQREVTDAEDLAGRLGRAGKLSDAVAVLRDALSKVEESTSLPDDKRDKLARELHGMIRAFDPTTARTYTPKPPPVSRGPVADNRGPVNQAGSTITGRAGALADQRALNDARAKGFQTAQNSVFESAVMPSGDYQFPSPEKWKELSKLRSKSTMTERERAIMTELNKTRSVEFKGETFQDVINYLSKSTGQTITVPRNILEEAGVTYETPIKLEMKNVTTRSVLKKMLAELNLTYIIKDEAIEITTPERASRTLTTRTYYVGDLLAAATNPFAGPLANEAAVGQQINSLMAMIVNTYDPDSWQIRGGPGTIVYNPISKAFIVRQTAEMHFMLGVGMR